MKNLMVTLGVLFLIFATILIGCEGPVETTTATATETATVTVKPITVTFSTTVPETSYTNTEVLEPWIKQIEAATNGRVKFDVYYSESLVKSAALWEALLTGVADMGDLAFSAIPGTVTLTRVTTLPHMFYNDGNDYASAVWQLYETAPEVAKEYEPLKMMCFYSPGMVSLLTSDKQVESREDLSGLKIRAAPGEASQKMVELAGGVAVTMGGGEVYESLQKGVIDGVFGPWEFIGAFRFYEVAQYMTHGPFSGAIKSIAASPIWWDSLPTDIQDQIMSVSGLKGSQFWTTAFDKAKEDTRSRVSESGYTIHEYTIPAEEVQDWLDMDGEIIYDWWAQQAVDKAIQQGYTKPEAEALAKSLFDKALEITSPYKK